MESISILKASQTHILLSFLVRSLNHPSQIQFLNLSSGKMRITQVIAFVAIAISGVVSAPPPLSLRYPYWEVFSIFHLLCYAVLTRELGFVRDRRNVLHVLVHL